MSCKLPKEDDWHSLVPMKASILALKHWHPLVPEKDSFSTLENWHQLVPVEESCSTFLKDGDSTDVSYPDEPVQIDHRHQFKIDKLYLEVDKRETINIEQDDQIFQLKRTLKRFQAENRYLKCEQDSLNEEQQILFLLKSCYRNLIGIPDDMSETIDHHQHQRVDRGEVRVEEESNKYHNIPDGDGDNASHMVTQLPDYCRDMQNIDQLYLEINKREAINVEQEDEIFQLERQLKRVESENYSLKGENNYLKEEDDLSVQLKYYYKSLLKNLSTGVPKRRSHVDSTIHIDSTIPPYIHPYIHIDAFTSES